MIRTFESHLSIFSYDGICDARESLHLFLKETSENILFTIYTRQIINECVTGMDLGLTEFQHLSAHTSENVSVI